MASGTFNGSSTSMMAIYTRKGDKGETSLYETFSSKRKRVSKSSLRMESLGGIDELNSYLGICISYSENHEFKKILTEVQKDLLTTGSIIGGSKLSFSNLRTKKLEKIIDRLEARLPPLKNFVFPGGSRLAAKLQYARSLARNAERKVVALNKKEKVRPQVLKYLNRLSDFLFMLARKMNQEMGVNEKIWVGKRT